MMANIRKRGSMVSGGDYSNEDLSTIWLKATATDNNDYRKDVYGTLMKWQDYGNTNSKHGWEVDHIKPVSKGGLDLSSNLQALQWENNRTKGDKYP